MCALILHKYANLYKWLIMLYTKEVKCFYNLNNLQKNRKGYTGKSYAYFVAGRL